MPVLCGDCVPVEDIVCEVCEVSARSGEVRDLFVKGGNCRWLNVQCLNESVLVVTKSCQRTGAHFRFAPIVEMARWLQANHVPSRPTRL